MSAAERAEVVDVVVVGGGPRAVATVERLDARVRATDAAPVSVVVIDAVEVGAGATWRTDQTAQFLNNTTSDATTIHPDRSTPIDGPLGDGPTFVEWAREVSARGAHDVAWAFAEAQRITPGSFPTRRLQGVYYNDQLARAAERGGVRLTRVLGSVVDLERDADARVVRLTDGRQFRADAIVLAQGMVQAEASASVRAFADNAVRLGLLYIDPGMPAEKPWHLVPAGEPVIAQGLGANFFDVVAELTAGRGGRFHPVADDPHGRLRYVPSGAEPIVHAASRRGVPYRSKGDFGDGPVVKHTPSIATADWFDRLQAAPTGSVDFAAEVWPTIAAELGLAWLQAVEARHPGAVLGGLDVARDALIRAAAADAASADERTWAGAVPHTDAALAALVAEPGNRFRIEELRRPTLGRATRPGEWDAHVARLVEDELDSLADPAGSPRQAVNLAMGALRGRASRLAVQGVLTARSQVRDIQGWFNADGLFLASGPPASRVREVLALIEAGIVRLVGPETWISVDEESGAFRARSAITGRDVSARSLIETRMSKGKVPNTSDPLLRTLLRRGDARIHTLRDASGAFETESLEALPRQDTEHPLSLVDAAGRPDPRVLVLGIPASSTQPGSAIGAAPGVPSPLLAGADRAAAVILGLLAEADAARPLEALAR
ncbi:FAD/NAD(P)-binding protein [Microbacterium sp. NPDC057659]|uniref:FAD/NAD(P)-binding protein n=1 Tax=Microbacterium sp. NPDC057659 TaxID=3346198 RepID=UPI003670A1EE